MSAVSFTFRDLDRTAVDAIAAYRYDPPYDFYDTIIDFDDLDNDELLAPSRWGVTVWGVYDGDDLVGFAELNRNGDVIEIGLGQRPDMTGRGRLISSLSTAISPPAQP